ncbi:tetratricopeptide repeat domain-containing protein [Penicillium hispanicum]|uniref:tetratricopeptide repeat domain-containing protein n=1 Tax=Penicillium hispanicum TaxID=1080232 RepID=UPI0025415A6C|nr:tetratricopeptide repeat domain-containing protein [Penicillium hispanicum]KAJ5577490.1 tetratricopeptide repeat domain-containing protein [Penicillium hispanicum]
MGPTHVVKSKDLGKQINHNIWRILGNGQDANAYASVAKNNLREGRTDIIRRPIDIANENSAGIASDRNKVFSIPQPASRLYTGRTDVLKELQDSLQSCPADGRPQRRKIIFIVGESGSGKTQLCCQVAEKNRSRYSAVFYIDARSADETRHTCCNTDGAVSVSPPAKQEKPKRSTVTEWLATHEEPWLLIVDNIKDVDELRDILPDGDTGHILTTTRQVLDDETAHSIRLTGTDTEDAHELLLGAAQRAKPWTSVELEWATAIVAGLKKKPLPLTLIQIAASIRCGLSSPHEYRLLLSESLKKIGQRCSDYTSDQQHAIAVLEISLAQMKKQKLISSQDATKLAYVFPFFCTRSVSFEAVQKALVASHSVKTRKNRWYRKTSKRPRDTWIQRRRHIHIPRMNSHHEPDSMLGSLAASRTKWALMELLEMSLLIRDESNDTYSMHGMTQEWIRSNMHPAQRAIWQGIADKACLPTPPKSD